MAFLLIGFGIIVYFKFSRVGLHERFFEGRNDFLRYKRLFFSMLAISFSMLVATLTFFRNFTFGFWILLIWSVLGHVLAFYFLYRMIKAS